ncbi:MAG TPA: TonB-dependent receptor, partial [Pyrinomonadaceae bacterium]
GLTRQAFTASGDANQNAVSFGFVFSPLNYTYSLSRVTPVNNFSNDFTWTINNHTLQFGGNVRLIRNVHKDLTPAFDNAVVNPFFYANSGQSLLMPVINAGYTNIDASNLFNQAAIAAVIGRFSQYTARYNYDLAGNIIPTGTPVERIFAAEEYDVYFQDSWKIKPNFTLNFGLRYGLSRPVYETQGYQVRPTFPLEEFFERRLAGMKSGQPYNELLQFQPAGPKNNAPGFYGMDKNNFQPRISAVWSPGFKTGFLSGLFGKNNESVLRGGFAVTNDYFGQQLAVTFDNLSSLGFTTSTTIAPNTYNVTTNPGPLLTGLGQQINNLPGVLPIPNRFQTPADESLRIESSLNSKLVSPINYNWNLTYGRKLPKGFYIEASYVGRSVRNLLIERDVAAFNNLRDPVSGMDWYTAAGKIYDLYYGGVNINTIQPIPYFENLFPGLGAMLPNVFGLPAQPNSTRAAYSLNQNYSLGDWTLLQLFLDDDRSGGDGWSNLFIHPQYAAFSAYSTVGRSNYHGANLSIRQRFGTDLSFDLNYTFSKSMDDASGLQSSGAYGAAFVLNSILQEDSYSVSDFDVRHVINANAIWQVPIGKGRKFFNNLNKIAEAFLGGWQFGGIYRWNTGLPFSAPIDLGGWATNWQIRSKFVRTKPISTSYFRGGNGENANIFRNINELINVLRPPRPGETGDRNVFRSSGFSVLDMNLSKIFAMPWNEKHKLQLRYEVFNVFNYHYLSGIKPTGISPAKPPTPANSNGSEASIFAGAGEFTSIRGNARRMQFGLRYSF